MTNDEDDFRHVGAWNSFKFDPDPRHDDVLVLADRAEELGYRLLFRDAGYSLEEVQTRLREEGPSAFLKIVRLREDISPQAPTPTIEQFLSERLARLAPMSELIITDPYLFTSTRRRDADVYAASVTALVSPLLNDRVALTVVVDPAASNADVQEAIRLALTDVQPTLAIRVVHSSDFHDRFWIADRTRGIILGSSLNKIGGKVFFVDSLSDRDVAAVVSELTTRGV